MHISMADQCIVCLDLLDNIPAESDSANTELALKHAQMAQPIFRNDSSKTNKEQSIAVLQTCGHILHDSCLQAWIEKANSCPICRQAFNLVEVYDKVGGKMLSTYTVEDKKQVADFDPTAWIDDEEEEESNPCPVCGSSENEEELLLCDRCDAPYHTHCAGLSGVPVGSWFCQDCIEHFYVTPHHDRPTRQPRTWTQRTIAQVRRARRRTAADNWAGAWNQISGRVWDALNLDLDYSDEDQALTNYRNHQRRAERERREFQQWQTRLRIASRQGARDVFTAAARPILTAREQPETPKQTADEERAWKAFEKARESDLDGSSSRKRKTRSITKSPIERSEEPERKLKRPKTRRVVNRPGSSSYRSSADRANSSVAASSMPSTVAGPVTDSASAPSFLSSLLKEVEMSTNTDDEGAQIPHGTTATSPSAGHSSPAVSPPTSSYSTPRAISITPPPYRAKRPGSPLPLTSHVEPIYPRADYSPNRSPPDHHHHLDGEIRQPRPRRKQALLPRSEDSSPSRVNISIEAKEGISKIVRTALEPHYKKPAGITKEQYADINRLVSHMLYEKIVNPDALDENEKSAWEKIANAEVTKAVEGLIA